MDIHKSRPYHALPILISLAQPSPKTAAGWHHAFHRSAIGILLPQQLLFLRTLDKLTADHQMAPQMPAKHWLCSAIPRSESEIRPEKTKKLWPKRGSQQNTQKTDGFPNHDVTPCGVLVGVELPQDVEHQEIPEVLRHWNGPNSASILQGFSEEKSSK